MPSATRSKRCAPLTTGPLLCARPSTHTQPANTAISAARTGTRMEPPFDSATIQQIGGGTAADSDQRGVTSTKQILFDVAAAPFRSVSRPSATVTVTVASSHRAALVVVPLTAVMPSALIAKVEPKYDGSPATMRTS